MSSRGWASPSSSRSRPATRARPPPRSSIRRGMTSKLRVAPRLDRPGRGRRDRASRPGCRCCGPSASSGSGCSIEELRRARRCAAGWGPRRSGPGGLNRWIGQVVGVVGPFALATGPSRGSRGGRPRGPSACSRRASRGSTLPRGRSGRGPSGSAAGRSTARARGRPGRRGRSCRVRARWRSMAAWVR